MILYEKADAAGGQSVVNAKATSTLTHKREKL